MSMLRNFLVGGVAAIALAGVAHAAGNNNPPPDGAIYSLDGLSVPHVTAQTYSVNFLANQANTDLTFAFREDPAYISFSNVVVNNLTTGSLTNLVTNGDFGGGTYTSNGNSSAPVGWDFANIYGATASGVVASNCQGGFANCWLDGSVQAYDAISQTIGTTVGSTYRVSFSLIDNSGLTTFSSLSTNGDTTDTGGNGINVAVYAQAGLPAPGGTVTAAPEPGTWALLLGGVGILGALLRIEQARRREDEVKHVATA